MRRTLVLTDEAARHPFRRMMPAASLMVNERDMVYREDHPVRTFALTFTAAFIAIYGFIA
jgi:hypothetical protein